MFWLPGLFLLLEFLYFASIKDFPRFYANHLLKSQGITLTEQMNKFNNDKKPIAVIVAFYILFLTIYCVIGLFYSTWFFTAILLSLFLIEHLIPTKNYYPFLDMKEVDKLEDGTLIRQIKLENIDGTYKRIRIKRYTIDFLFSTIRMVVLATIIILHYNFNYI